jgi:NitT/TauT family transport system substrate-binding protein
MMRALLVLLVAILTAGLPGPMTPTASVLAAPGPAAAGQATPASVTVGSLPVSAGAALFVAIERGYLAEQNVTVNLENFTSGAEVLTSTAAGQLNLGTAASVGSGALNALSRGLDVRIIATSSAEYTARPSGTVVLRKIDGRALTVPELRGRKVAVNSVGVASEYILDAGLRSGGLTVDDVDLQQIPFPDMVAALTNGSIDAAMMAEPFITRLVQSGVGEAMNNILHDHFQTTVTFVNTRWAAQNPDVARRYTVALVRAFRDLQGDAWARDDIAQIMAKYTRLDAELLKATNSPYFDPDGRVNTDSIMEQQRFYMARGQLTYREPLDIRNYVDESFLDSALLQLGPSR